MITFDFKELKVRFGLLGDRARTGSGLWINHCYRFGAKRQLRIADRVTAAANMTKSVHVICERFLGTYTRTQRPGGERPDPPGPRSTLINQRRADSFLSR